MQNSIQRGLMELVWRLVPNPRRVLERLGKTPPVLKGPLLERIARVGLDVARYRGTDELPTNFAINGPVVWIPIGAGRVYFFGNPARRFGEASTIRLRRDWFSHSLDAPDGTFSPRTLRRASSLDIPSGL
jgi:hypothetical protein